MVKERRGVRGGVTKWELLGVTCQRHLSKLAKLRLKEGHEDHTMDKNIPTKGEATDICG